MSTIYAYKSQKIAQNRIFFVFFQNEATLRPNRRCGSVSSAFLCAKHSKQKRFFLASFVRYALFFANPRAPQARRPYSLVRTTRKPMSVSDLYGEMAPRVETAQNEAIKIQEKPRIAR